MTNADRQPRVADVAHSALMDAGHPDLAELVCFYWHDDESPYLLPLWGVTAAEWAIMERAESLALEAWRAGRCRA